MVNAIGHSSLIMSNFLKVSMSLSMTKLIEISLAVTQLTKVFIQGLTVYLLFFIQITMALALQNRVP